MASNKNPHTLFSSSSTSSEHFTLFLDNLIHEGAQIHDLLNALHNAGEDDTLEVRINSGGGYVKYGQQLINVIRGRFKDRCVTIIEADAASMAALVFMAGDSRVVYEHSTLMVHDLSMYLVGKASESKKQLEAETYVFKNKFRSLFSKCLDEEEIESIFEGKDEWFNALEMCERGMATHVITIARGMVTADEYIEMQRNPEKERRRVLEQEKARYLEAIEEMKESILDCERKCKSINEELEKMGSFDEISYNRQTAK